MKKIKNLKEFGKIFGKNQIYSKLKDQAQVPWSQSYIRQYITVGALEQKIEAGELYYIAEGK